VRPLCREVGDGKKPICVEACPPHALDAGILDELKIKYGEVTEAHNFDYSKIVQPSMITKPTQR
jgi:Fe-S-cluster-containing dehydrogenase component